MICDALFSPDRVYRYWLVRVWDDKLAMLANIGCNPSTADETINDPTVRKDIGFAKRLGYGGLLKLNVGAYRATNPKKWAKAGDPIGPDNTVEDIHIYLDAFGIKQVIVAWGRCIGRYAEHGDLLARSLRSVCTVSCFGRNADGTPKHTLMLPYTTKLVRY